MAKKKDAVKFAVESAEFRSFERQPIRNATPPTKGSQPPMPTGGRKPPKPTASSVNRAS